MNPADRFLRHLAREDVAELAVSVGRLPCVKVGGTFRPIENTPMGPEDIRDLLVAAGGRAKLPELGETPVSWTHVVEGIGTVTVAAIVRGGVAQARVAVTARANLAASQASPAYRGGETGEVHSAREAESRGGMPQGFESHRQAASSPGLSHTGAVASVPSSALRGSTASPPMAPPPVVAESAPGLESAARQRVSVSAPRAPVAPGEFRFDGSFASLLIGARSLNASDLHIVAGRPALFRIGGDLQPKGEVLEPEVVESVILPIVPKRLLESFKKDGTCDFAIESPEYGRARANVVRQRTGIKACFRLIGLTVPTLESLGLPEGIAAATHHHQGLIVITGPTGHGKTTTLTAIVDLINSETSHHIISVEDPVEYVHSRKKAMMSQREVGTHTKSFRAALKGSLREDPDVIVIGELRDTETVRIALSASETGHLVIGTMNTPSAAKTIDRIIDLFPPGDQQQVRLTLAGGLKLVVSQRLVPNADRTGMHAACELLPGNVALWNLIRDSKTFQIPSLQQRGKGLGIIRLDDSLAELVRSGKSSRENVMPFAEAPDELDARISGKPAIVLPPTMQMPGAAPPKKEGADSASKPGGILSKAGSLFGGKKGT